MERVSKKLRSLKVNSKHVDDFDTMKQALERSGVVKRQVRAERCSTPKGQQDKPTHGGDHGNQFDKILTNFYVAKVQNDALVARCVLTRHDKGYCFVEARGKRYFLHYNHIWGGVKPQTGDRFQIVANESITRVLRAVRLRRE